MRQESVAPAHVLRKILDQYRNTAVALIGCHSLGLERPSCEFDVVIVTDERQPPASLKLKDYFVDLLFLNERELLKPRNPEAALALARVRAIRDSALIMSTSSATNTAVFEVNARKSAQGRLASAVKALGRADEALGKGATQDADYWLLRASYDYGYAWLYTRQGVPAPSHLLHQLRKESRGSSRNFEAFSKGTGLERASRAANGARLEGIGVLHDVLRSRRQGSVGARAMWSEPRFSVISRKAEYLTAAMDHVECQSFLGLETLVALRTLSIIVAGRVASSEPTVLTRLSEGNDRVVGERLLSDLGLTRSQKTVETGLRAVKEQVSALARKL